MDRDILQSYLHRQIPLSTAMKVEVISATMDNVVLSAPLEPNINHKSTVFGGSASALAILAAWSLLHLRLETEGHASEIVIQSNRMDYDQPITGLFTATPSLPDGADWAGFVKMLQRKGMARIEIGSILTYDEKIAGRLSGRFVAFLNQK